MRYRPSPSLERRPAPLSSLELWGGIECTVNRVGDRYFDQITRTNHCTRIEDFDLFAELGIRTLRYPVLWERIAPDNLEDADWSWTDRALAKLRELEIRPIVGLVHHGSGPRHTSLLDPAFADKLSAFAGAVANRYPWIDMLTPVNEPLTTARFAALYGHWYPHARDDRSFVRALINQINAIRASMDAFRAVNPEVQLVQTEDLGKAYSTPGIAYQAEFENERRWLTVDLLSGCIDDRHPLWRFLRDNGATQDELESLLRHPCVPDIVGINHYLTGERFLDERIELYPEHLRGGNGRHFYADVEAVRVLENGIAGHLDLVGEAWTRYRLPLAITEVHLGCTREQQLRWLHEAWQSAQVLRSEGADVRAVTLWSMLGSYNWDSLLTREDGYYESGAFDMRSGAPRRTALALMAKCLATTGRFDHPALDGEGWWRKPERLSYPPFRIAQSPRRLERSVTRRRPLLVVGARGTLGSAFARVCAERGLDHLALSRQDLDITDVDAINRVLDVVTPWAVINCAGYVRVDDAEWDEKACLTLNRHAALSLGEACEFRNLHLTTFSSDLVFDGAQNRPYVEDDDPHPLNVYGSSKAQAERPLLALARPPLIVRTSAFFGPWDRYNFLTTTLKALAQGNPVDAAGDTTVSPTYVPDLVNATLDLVVDGERGIWHLANTGETTWAEFARKAARATGLDDTLVNAVDTSSLNLSARRPFYSALVTSKGATLPSLDDAIARYAATARRFISKQQAVGV